MSLPDFEVNTILFFQNFREISNHVFDDFFMKVTDFGITDITFILIFAVYWCYNKKIGTYMINCFTVAYLMNIFLKLTFCVYRPWMLDNRINPLDAEYKTAPGYSFPSGHISGATACWGSFAIAFWKNKIIRYLCMVIIFLVMFSRVYIGVHTIVEVVASLFVTILVILAVRKLFQVIEKKEYKYGSYIIGFCFVCAALCFYILSKQYPIDYVNGKILYNPEGIAEHHAIRIINLLFITLGCYLESKFIKFNPEKGGMTEKIIRLVVGLFILNLINTKFASFLNSHMDYYPARTIKYITEGFYLTFLYPLFIKIYEFRFHSKKVSVEQTNV